MDDAPVILVVEDEADARDLARLTLSGRGYLVLTAPDAETALKYLRNVIIDVLFVDLVLPGGMNGLQLARLAQVINPALKVVCTTGFGAQRADLLRTPSTILAKPYHPRQLVAEIERAVSG